MLSHGVLSVLDRASFLMNILQKEEFENIRNGREWVDFCAGDTIAISQMQYSTAKAPSVFKGVVISKVNRGSDSSVTMLNVSLAISWFLWNSIIVLTMIQYLYGTTVVRTFRLYNPLVKDIKLLKKAFIHEGKKRVRRSKIYYYMDKDPNQYTIK
jgi:ribosomal protein L19